MTNTRDRWVLAFDGSCRVCRDMSQAVAQACGDKLEVLSLNRPEVRQWRHQALGANASWAPTLIQSSSTEVRAWLGIRMIIPLIRQLGFRSTVAVLAALGRVRRDTRRKRRSVVPVVVGLAVVLSMIKGSPGGGNGDAPRAWVEANRDNLPRDYDGISAHSIPYRKAIARALPGETRAALWTEHLNRYRSDHPDLSGEQLAVLDQALELFPRVHGSDADRTAELRRLEEAGKAAFDRAEARAVLETLGPTAEHTAPSASDLCSCATDSDYCDSDQYCSENSDCTEDPDSCGTGWAFDCDGLCRY